MDRLVIVLNRTTVITPVSYTHLDVYKRQDEWIETIERRKKVEYQHVIAVAYLLCGFSDLHRLSKNHIVYVVLARKVFGREYMKVVGDRVQSLLREWGYLRTGTLTLVLRTIFEGLLYKRSPHLDQLKIEDLQEVIARRPPRTGRFKLTAVSAVRMCAGMSLSLIHI